MRVLCWAPEFWVIYSKRYMVNVRLKLPKLTMHRKYPGILLKYRFNLVGVGGSGAASQVMLMLLEHTGAHFEELGGLWGAHRTPSCMITLGFIVERRFKKGFSF